MVSKEGIGAPMSEEQNPLVDVLSGYGDSHSIKH